jgi:large subunit ribosomal protein L10
MRKGGVNSLRLEDKQAVVEDLADKLSRAKVVIATDYKGLDVEEMNALRRKLREAGCEYQVAKNTLLKRASKDTDSSLLEDAFKGPSAIAINFDDPVAPAKVLTEFAKGNNKLEIKAGAMAGKALSLDDIKALSALPSREALLGQVLSVMNGVPTSFVRVLSGNISNLVNVLQAIKDKKESA